MDKEKQKTDDDASPTPVDQARADVEHALFGGGCYMTHEVAKSIERLIRSVMAEELRAANAVIDARMGDPS